MTIQTPFITNCLVTIVHTKPVNTNFSPKIGCNWQRPFDTQSRLWLHQIAWPRKPTPRIKLHVASNHTTKVIAHHMPKPVIANCVPKLVAIECPYTLQWDAHSPPKICPFPWRDLDPHLICGSLVQPKSWTRTTARSVQPFLQGSLVWQTDRQTTLLGR